MAHQRLPRDAGDPAPGVDLDDPRRVRAAQRLVPAHPGSATLDNLSSLAARLLGSRSAQVSLLTDVQHVAAGTGLLPGALTTVVGPVGVAVHGDRGRRPPGGGGGGERRRAGP